MTQNVRVFDRNPAIIKVVAKYIPVSVKPSTYLYYQSTIYESLDYWCTDPFHDFADTYRRPSGYVPKRFLLHWTQFGEVSVEKILNIQGLVSQLLLSCAGLNLAQKMTRKFLEEPGQALTVFSQSSLQIPSKGLAERFFQTSEESIDLPDTQRPEC